MVRVAIGTITYNDREGLYRLIKSLDGNADIHFIIDGKYPNFPGDSEYSNDGTLEMLETFQRTAEAYGDSRNTVDRYHKIHVSLLAAPEHQKRQKYVELCERYAVDALIILDSDEYVDNDNTNWRELRDGIDLAIALQSFEENKWNVHNVQGFWGCIQQCPRLWIHPFQMQYVNESHKTFKNKYHDQYLNRYGSMYAVPQVLDYHFRFIQDSSYRTKERIEQSKKYYEWLNNFEPY